MGRSRKMHGFRRAVLELGILTTLLISALACSPGNGGRPSASTPGDDAPVTIRISRPAFRRIDLWLSQKIREYEAAHPDVRIRFEPTPGEEYLIKLRTQLSAGVAPDAYTINGQNIPAFAAQGLLAVPPPEIQQALRRDYMPGAVSYCSWNGTVYGFPYEGGSRVIFYNKEIFRRAGITQLPRDWAELTSAAILCTRYERGRMIQEGFGLYGPGSGPHAVCSLAAFVWSNGGYFTQKGRPSFTEPPFLEAVQFLTDLHLRYGVSSLEFIPFREGFLIGRVAMIVGGPWHIQDFRTKNPDLDFGVFLIPPPRADLDPAVDNSPAVWVVNPRSGHRPEVWEFLQFLQTPENQVNFTRAHGTVPYHIEALKDPLFRDDPIISIFAHSVRHMRMRPRPYWFQIERLLGAQLELALLGELPPLDAMRQAERDVARQIQTLGTGEALWTLGD